MCLELCNQMLSKNPSSICHWTRCPYKNNFDSVCVAFKASLDGFINGCRLVIGLDGTFLKEKYGSLCVNCNILKCQQWTISNWDLCLQG